MNKEWVYILFCLEETVNLTFSCRTLNNQENLMHFKYLLEQFHCFVRVLQRLRPAQLSQQRIVHRLQEVARIIQNRKRIVATLLSDWI